MRKIVSLQINPVFGNMVALCEDGSVWTREGRTASAAQSWTPVKDIPDAGVAEPSTETEDEITTHV